MFKEIENHAKSVAQETIIISNIVQGTLWKTKYADFLQKNIFPIFLFFDDFEPGNALGTHAGQQKLEGVYIPLPCLSPHISVKLSNLFSALIFYSKDRAENSTNRDVFQPIINELNALFLNGINLEINGEQGASSSSLPINSCNRWQFRFQ